MLESYVHIAYVSFLVTPKLVESFVLNDEDCVLNF